MNEEGRTINIFDKQVEDFIESIRPPADVRDKLDIGYRYENSTLMIFQIRLHQDPEAGKVQIPVAKTRFIKSRSVWVIYWMSGDGNWKKYEPNPEVNSIRDVFDELMEDRHQRFWV